MNKKVIFLIILLTISIPCIGATDATMPFCTWKEMKDDYVDTDSDGEKDHPFRDPMSTPRERTPCGSSCPRASCNPLDTFGDLLICHFDFSLLCCDGLSDIYTICHRNGAINWIAIDHYRSPEKVPIEKIGSLRSSST